MNADFVRAWAVIVLAVAAAFSQQPREQEASARPDARAQPSLAEVLARHADSCGGAGALAEAGDFVIEATVHAAVPWTRRSYVRRQPFALRLEITAAGATPRVALTDGRHAYVLRPDGKVNWLTGEDARHLLEGALVDGLLYLEPPPAGGRLLRGPVQKLAMPSALPAALRDDTPVWPVAAMLACGTEVRLYFDAGDGRLRGFANTAFMPQRNVRFGDWRGFGTLRLPASRWENRGADVPVHVQVTDIRFGPLAAELFAALPAVAADATVDVGPLHLVPTEIPGTWYPLVPTVGIDRRVGVTALFDTGAGRTYLDDRLADTLGLAVLAHRPIRGVTARSATSQRWLEVLELPHRAFHQLEVGATRLPATIQDEHGGWPSVVLGGEILCHGPVLDVGRGRLLLRGTTPEPLEGENVFSLPLVVAEHHDLVAVAIAVDGQPVTAVVDSGMPVALRLRPAGLRAAGLPLDAASWLARGALPMATTGAGGGAATDLLVQLSSLRLGTVVLERPWAQIALNDGTGAASYDAAIGTGLLRWFGRVGLDRRRNRLELDPGVGLARRGERWHAPPPGAFLGLRVEEADTAARQRGERLPRIVDVAAGSAAAAAGLRPGDLLQAVGDVLLAAPAPMGWREQLWARGAVTLDVDRPGAGRQQLVLTP